MTRALRDAGDAQGSICDFFTQIQPIIALA
jgi:hypothetical protein